MIPALKIDGALVQKAADFARTAGYSSVSEFVTHLIERELAGQGGGTLDNEEEAKKRLQGLGYID